MGTKTCLLKKPQGDKNVMTFKVICFSVQISSFEELSAKHTDFEIVKTRETKAYVYTAQQKKVIFVLKDISFNITPCT